MSQPRNRQHSETHLTSMTIGSSETNLQQSITQAAIVARPYPPSWVDGLIAWIERWPGPAWQFYMLLLLVLVLLRHALLWSDGSLPPGSFDWVLTTYALLPVYVLALMHYLNSVARRALATFRPALAINESEYVRLYYELTTIPARLGLVTVGIGVVLAILGTLNDPADYNISGWTSVATLIYTSIIVSFSSATIAAFIFRTIRQLRFVNQIHRRATSINLFQLTPVHAFSTLTARTGIGLIFFSFLIVAPGAASGFDPASIGTIIVMLLMATASFLLPLNEMHRRLVEEQERLTSEANRRLEALIATLHQRVDGQNLEKMDDVNKAMASLILERETVGKISTWPWQPETLRGFISAVVLPIVLWLVTTILGRII